MSLSVTLKQRWQGWSERFAALSRRERAILAFALVVGGGFLLYSLGVEPLLLKSRAAARAEIAAREQTQQQQVLLAALKAGSSDPDAPNRQRLAQARQQLGQLGERLAKFETGMVPPSRMQGFLEGLLAKNRNLELLSLQTLPVTEVGTTAPERKADGAAAVAPATAATAAAVAGAVAGTVSAANPGPGAPAAGGEGIYQHGIELRLAGSYNDLLAYLGELERMPQRVMWSSVSLTVEKYPRNVLVLRVYTLSLDKNWLVV